MADLSIISIKNITNAFYASIKNYKALFISCPILAGIFMPILLCGSNVIAIAALNSFLTSFVPLFATILTFYLSWCYNKIDSRHNQERIQLFKETSTNILMMIPLDAATILCYVFSTISLLPSTELFPEITLSDIPEITNMLQTLTWNRLIKYIFLVPYYAGVTEIMLILLMVCKRAFVIITNEIALLNPNDGIDTEKLDSHG